MESKTVQIDVEKSTRTSLKFTGEYFQLKTSVEQLSKLRETKTATEIREVLTRKVKPMPACHVIPAGVYEVEWPVLVEAAEKYA